MADDQDGTKDTLGETASLDDVNPEILRALRSITLFESLSDEEFLRMAANAVLQEVNPGEVIFQSHDEVSEVLYAISSGRVAVQHTTLSGGRIASFELGGGVFFGNHPILQGVCRDCTISAFSRTTLLQLEKTSYFELAPRLHPEIGQELARPYLVSFLDSVPPFSLLSEPARFCDNIDFVEYRPDHVIVQEGDSCHEIYILYAGQARSEFLQPDGTLSKEKVSPGETVGARTLLTKGVWNLSLVSMTPTTWLIIGLEAFDELIVELPQLVPDNDDPIRFDWQSPGEHVVYAARSHWVYLLSLTCALMLVLLTRLLQRPVRAKNVNNSR